MKGLVLKPHEILFTARRRGGLTQREAAEVTGVSKEDYGAMELGDTPVKIPKGKSLPNVIPTKLEACIILRRRRGWRQRFLAKKIKVSRVTVNRMEKGIINADRLYQYWGV